MVQLRSATFQVFSGRMWLVAAVLDSPDPQGEVHVQQGGLALHLRQGHANVKHWSTVLLKPPRAWWVKICASQ